MTVKVWTSLHNEHAAEEVGDTDFAVGDVLYQKTVVLFAGIDNFNENKHFKEQNKNAKIKVLKKCAAHFMKTGQWEFLKTFSCNNFKWHPWMPKTFLRGKIIYFSRSWSKMQLRSIYPVFMISKSYLVHLLAQLSL